MPKHSQIFITGLKWDNRPFQSSSLKVTCVSHIVPSISREWHSIRRIYSIVNFVDAWNHNPHEYMITIFSFQLSSSYIFKFNGITSEILCFSSMYNLDSASLTLSLLPSKYFKSNVYLFKRSKSVTNLVEVGSCFDFIK